MAAIITNNPSDRERDITGVMSVISKDSSVIGALSAAVVPRSRVVVDVPCKLLALESHLGTFVSSPTVIVNKNGTPVAGVSNAGWARSKGTIEVVAKASMVDNETFTLDDGVNPAIVFEIRTAGGGVTVGDVEIDLSTATSATDVAVLVKTAINTAAPLNITASNALGVLTLINDLYGAYDTTIATTATPAFTVASFTGGLAYRGAIVQSLPTSETLLVPGDVLDVEVTVTGGSSDLTNRLVLARVYG